MGYQKKSFDGDNLKYYNIIKTHGKTSVTEIYAYTNVAGNIKSLYWDGDCKNEVCNTLDSIDKSCSSFYNVVSCLIKKTKIVYGVLGPELNLLKSKIELYNECVDDYDKTYAQLQSALNNNGGSNG